jgi:hypothetical protein
MPAGQDGCRLRRKDSTNKSHARKYGHQSVKADDNLKEIKEDIKPGQSPLKKK